MEKKEKAWAICRNKSLLSRSVRDTQYAAKADFLKSMNQADWSVFEKKGYQCVEVEVTWRLTEIKWT